MDVPHTSAQEPLGHYLNRGSEQESSGKGAINKSGYIDIDMRPQLPFGHGLSYTEFTYSDFKVQMDKQENSIMNQDIGLLKRVSLNFIWDETANLYFQILSLKRMIRRLCRRRR